ncbi:MAG: pilus assembly protein N-terminal domain-containing protein [Xanthobacteraceae bacterium]
MTSSFRRRTFGRLSALAVALALFAPSGASQASATDIIPVMLDQARVLKLPEQLATLVVGNPLIADVTVQPGGILVLTGKGYGVTNLIALDHNGKVLLDHLIEVQGAPDTVVVYRGITRESYSCTPFCDRRVTLGDTPDYFDRTLKQTSDRNATAQTGGGAMSGHAPR